MTIERECEKEMGADRGPLLNALDSIERVHRMTPHDEAGVPVMPWFAGVKPGTYVRFVPKAIVAAKPWCSVCGQPMEIEAGPAWQEPIFVCRAMHCSLSDRPSFTRDARDVQKTIERTIPEILVEANQILGDMTWIDLPPAPRAPWWKRAWARVKECL